MEWCISTNIYRLIYILGGGGVMGRAGPPVPAGYVDNNMQTHIYIYIYKIIMQTDIYKIIMQTHIYIYNANAHI